MNNKLTVAIEIIIFAAIVVLDAAGYVPISQTILLIPTIWLALKVQKEKFKSIGLCTGKKPLWKSILIGTILGVVLELFATYGTTPLLSGFFGTEPDLTEMQDIEGNLSMLILFIALSWILAAFGEEICFRGFLMNRLAKLFGGHKTAWIVSLILSSILFGWGHTEQGISGWVQEGLSGLYLGIIFLYFDKNLTIPIISHGVSNTVAFVLIYFGNYPGI